MAGEVHTSEALTGVAHGDEPAMQHIAEICRDKSTECTHACMLMRGGASMAGYGHIFLGKGAVCWTLVQGQASILPLFAWGLWPNAPSAVRTEVIRPLLQAPLVGGDKPA